MCGADDERDSMQCHDEGSPPRVRSRQGRVVVAAGGGGITSACAEQTEGFKMGAVAGKDHLRVCGADPGIWYINWL